MTDQKFTIPITGMTCANCAANIERTLNKRTSGVVNAAVNFATERLSAEYVPGVLTVEDIVAAIEKAGYGAIPPEEGLDEEDAARAAAEIGARRLTRLEPSDFRRRLQTYLARRGFSYAVIKPLIEEMLEAHCEALLDTEESEEKSYG